MLDYGRFVYKSRVWAGYANRAIKRSFSTQQVNKRREILSSRQVPDFPVTPGAVMAVTMVKDEADIIDRVITHLLEQEVDRVIVADNMSSDDTPQILAELASKYPVTVVQDNLAAYYQSEKMTALAKLARNHGAKWVIPFDADELWFAPGATLASYLRASDKKQFRAAVHNAIPTETAGVWRLDQRAASLPKTAVATLPGMNISMGNHFVDRPGETDAGMRLIHLPWRSLEQIERKSTQGSLALRLAEHEGRLGRKWHETETALAQDAAGLWQDLLNGNPHPALDLNWSADSELITLDELPAWPFARPYDITGPNRIEEVK